MKLSPFSQKRGIGEDVSHLPQPHILHNNHKMVPKRGPKGPVTDLMAAGTCQGLAAHWVQQWGSGSVDMAELTQAVLSYYCHRNLNQWKKKVDVNDFSSGGDEQ